MAETSPPTQHPSPPFPSPFTNTSPPPTLLTQGAEAHLYKTHFLNPSLPAALKIRPSKPYRHEILDRRLTRQRVLQEARCLAKLVREGVSVPAVLGADWEGKKGGNGNGGGAWLLMEWVDGVVVRVVLERWEVWVRCEGAVGEDKERKVKDLLARIGRVVGKMHQAGVIHGDLTTSNLMLRPVEGAAAVADGSASEPSLDGEVVLIDFGLASQSAQEEDRAVDLYVLERAFGSTHPKVEGFFDEVLKAYGESYKGANVVLKRLEDVRMRGRKRSMVG
ncbi:serine/threonine-protein kinase bud32 [Arachnomyces sp. PD_36]|nr:serine/threonine-protein kinase bud32 [Arachnomyces sp. PD_36]